MTLLFTMALLVAQADATVTEDNIVTGETNVKPVESDTQIQPSPKPKADPSEQVDRCSLYLSHSNSWSEIARKVVNSLTTGVDEKLLAEIGERTQDMLPSAEIGIQHKIAEVALAHKKLYTALKSVEEVLGKNSNMLAQHAMTVSNQLYELGKLCVRDRDAENAKLTSADFPNMKLAESVDKLAAPVFKGSNDPGIILPNSDKKYRWLTGKRDGDYYIVGKGDTMWKIAITFGYKQAGTVCRMNKHIRTRTGGCDRLETGDRILIQHKGKPVVVENVKESDIKVVPEASVKTAAKGATIKLDGKSYTIVNSPKDSGLPSGMVLLVPEECNCPK